MEPGHGYASGERSLSERQLRRRRRGGHGRRRTRRDGGTNALSMRVLRRPKKEVAHGETQRSSQDGETQRLRLRRELPEALVVLLASHEFGDFQGDVRIKLAPARYVRPLVPEQWHARMRRSVKFGCQHINERAFCKRK